MYKSTFDLVLARTISHGMALHQIKLYNKTILRYMYH